MKFFQQWIPISFVVLSLGCVEPVDIPLKEETSLLVVEGIITDAPGPYVVTLSLSSPVSQNQFIPERGATVTIEAGDGKTVSLSEISPGHYATDSAAIRGEIGQTYRLLVTRQNGESYESDREILRASPPIDSVYFSKETQVIDNSSQFGAQVYVDTYDPEGKSNFYRWTWKETWKYSVPFSSAYEYVGNLNTSLIEEKRFCFMNDTSNLIRVGSSAGNSEDIISGYPLVFITGETKRLVHRYSILVEQYVMSEEEFIFWKSIQEATENTGTLFDRQPQSVTGNVRNTNGQGERVLGYFSASGVSVKRAYVNGRDLNFNISSYASYVTQCYEHMDTILLGPNADAQVFAALADGKVFYQYYQPLIAIAGFLLTTPDCNDCTVLGGTKQVPGFWVE
ncbi:MAG: DUF4249 domain-containing protein [Bacteroidia bacterium]